MRSYLSLFALLFTALQLSSAQDDRQEKIWGAFVYTLHGDRTPYTSLKSRTLTPLGAYQLFGAGYAIRDRHITASTLNTSEPSHQISGISEFSLVNDEIEILSTTEQFVSASAQAFVQGLYPPAEELYEDTVPYDNSRFLNGTIMDYPLGGYQYSNIIAAGPKDPTSIYVSGHAACPSLAHDQSNYFESTEVRHIIEQTAPFYADLCTRVLCSVLPSETVNYYNAHYISDYLHYEYIHNTTARDMILPQDLDHARYLANQLVFAQNGHLNPSESENKSEDLDAIAGKTLAYYVVEALERNIHTQGAMNKISLVFGSVEPMVAFYSLLGLPSSEQSNFYGSPNLGASLALELFSWESDPLAPYPTSDTDLMVRFILRNETDSWDISAGFIPYPMFGFSPSQTVLPYKEFLSNLINNMMGVSSWCRTCSSSSVFCTAYTTYTDPYGDPYDTNKGMTPIIAGVIGFIVGFCVLAIAFILISHCGLKRLVKNLCSGFRCKGRRRSNNTNTHATWPASPGTQNSTFRDVQSENVELSNRSKFSSDNGAPDAYLANPTRESDRESFIDPTTRLVTFREVV